MIDGTQLLDAIAQVNSRITAKAPGGRTQV